MNDLKKLSSNPDLEVFDPELKLTYGPFEGSLRLRERIAEVHSSAETKLTADNVLVTPGSIMANFLILDAICGPGDHIICQYPTFGQLYKLPEFNGVDVGLWKMDDENGWMPSIDELAAMIKPNTKAIILKCASPTPSSMTDTNSQQQPKQPDRRRPAKRVSPPGRRRGGQVKYHHSLR